MKAIVILGFVLETQDFFIQFVVILLSARLMGELVSRFGMPAVIGELLAGVILGPSLLNWVEPTDIIKLLAEIGVVLLLFEVGLETDIKNLVLSGINSTLAALAGVVVPFALGFIIGYYFFGFSLLVSLFLGSTLTATSIGITVRVLSDLKKQNTKESQIVLGAAVLDDVIGVVLLAMLYEFTTGGGVSLFNAGKVVLFIGIFMVLAPIAAKIISLTIKRYDEVSEIPGLLPTTIISLILIFAWLSHKVGAPELLGGFSAGLALSRYFFFPLATIMHESQGFAHRVETQMRPIIHIFTPIFFVTVGLTLNLREVNWGSSFIWMLSLSILAAAVLGKLCSGWILFKENKLLRWAVGLAMIPRGEVGLIFAEVGRNSNIFDQDLYASLIIMIAVTTLLTPLALRWFYNGPGKERMKDEGKAKGERLRAKGVEK